MLNSNRVRIDRDVLEIVDRLRGETPRDHWVSWALRRAVNHDPALAALRADAGEVPFGAS